MSDNPPPPPPPPNPQNPRDKMSPFVQKLRSAPPDYYFQALNPPRYVDFFNPPTGPYFFYGTLMDPSILRDVLALDPTAAEQRKADFDLRPAYIVGYECKLWGQYPALVVKPGPTIEGAVFQVRTVEEGKRLAEYETANYRTMPCRIRFRDGKEPDSQNGYVFLFAGDLRELSEGTFDLQVWLRRMGRGDIVDELNAKSSS